MEIEDTLNEFEKVFNILDSIPFVAIASTPVRIAAGKIQAVVGAVMAIFGMVGFIITLGSKKFSMITTTGGENLLHGVLNMIRGFGEGLLAVTVIGSAVLLTAQYLTDFDPIIKYGKSVVPVEVYSSGAA
ncbi:MAG: hypothetical protein K1X28_02335 [Parachlamydiales bacterium]|nr:hypothetical protein [Parachlamydiales bacterium]